LLDNFGLYREGLRQAMAWHPDILYERYALTAFAGSLLARRLSLPLILEVNAPLAEEEARFRGLRLGWLARRLERAILRRADRVVVVSEALADHARRLGVPPERILVLPNAIDPEHFHPRREGRELRERYGLNGSLVLGFSGTLKPWHGVQHLLAAMARLRDTGLQAELLLIGDGPERENLAEQAQGLGLAARVHFAGAVAHEEMGAFLAACDVLVAPYGPMEDHWFSPLKVAEYRAMGVPVIASAIGQMADSLGEAQGVLLVPPGDEKSLAEAIAALASDEDRRRACGRAAAATSSWTWQALAARVLAEAETARREVWRWETA
jgi:glycosyltransferase involved in cell wall biosynthesis